MNTNSIGFLNTISQHIIYATGSIIKNRKVKNMENEIKQLTKLYLQRGFKITRIHDNSEFESLQPEMSDIGVSLNLSSKKEHVP